MAVTITGLHAWMTRLQAMERAVLRGAEKGMETALRAMADTLADYPPELPNQRYVRTNDLHDGWANADVVFAPMPGGISGTMTNPIAYGPDVEGATQAPIHQGRWPTTEGVQQAQEGAARETIEAAVLTEVRRG
jgi:hypothetical protein